MLFFGKILNDAKNTESQSVKYLFSQMDAVIVRLNKFEPLVSLSSTYLIKTIFCYGSFSIIKL